jgi:hypothetical protein
VDFRHRDLPGVDKRVFRLGLAVNYGLDEAGVRETFDRGVNYAYWTMRSRSMLGPLREALERDREKMVVATHPLVGFLGGGVRRGAERALRVLGTDYTAAVSVSIGSAPA